MIEAIGQILGNAIGVTLSPMPEIALVLMLFSASAARNSLSFLAGWLIGLTGIAVLTIALGIGSNADDESNSIVWILIGVVFLLLAFRQWRGRTPPGEEPEMPPWMNAVDRFTPGKAFGLGLALSALNPKNLGLTIAAGVSISSAGLDAGQEIAVMLIFIALASATVITTVTYYFLAGKRAEATLESIKVWLIAHNDAMMTVLFAIIGAKVLGDGIAGLG